MSTEMIKQRPTSSTYGHPAETFIAPSKEIDDLLSQGLSRKQIADKLSINNPDFFKGDLIRIDITKSLSKELNLRNTSGTEVGANDKFILGGKTAGGVTEKVVDGIPKTDVRVTITKVKTNN